MPKVEDALVEKAEALKEAVQDAATPEPDQEATGQDESKGH